MLLVLTNSADGTCDALMRIARETGQPAFRWNIDLWQQYDLRFDGDGFVFSDPTGRHIDAADADVLLLWRKPFTDLARFDDLSLEVADQAQARNQLGQWLQAVVALMKPQGRVRLVEPYADRRLPKLYQLRLARAYFAVPPSRFSVGGLQAGFASSVVVKPLGDPGVGDGKIFYTRCVDGEQLFRPYPWFVQQALTGGQDVTCVHIRGRSRFYVCDFQRGSDNIDWRVEINTEHQSAWQPLRHECLAQWEVAVNRYMTDTGLHYGRLDFILQDDTLYFLECNSNGQFGWLDGDDLSLHREFLAAALDPVATVC